MKRMGIFLVCCMVLMMHAMEKKDAVENTAERASNTWAVRGKKAYKAGKIELAQFYFQQAATYEQCQPAVYTYLGRILEKNQSLDTALAYHQKAAEHDESALNDVAVIYSIKGDKEQAEACFSKAIAMGNKQAICNLGLFYYKQKKYEKAEALLVQGIKHGYRRMVPILDIVCKKQGKDIVDVLSKDINDEIVSLINQLGALYYSQDESAMAEKCFKVASYYENVDALNNLGVLYYDQGKFHAAKICCQGALKKGHSSAFANLKCMYEACDEHEELDELYKEQDKRDAVNTAS